MFRLVPSTALLTSRCIRQLSTSPVLLKKPRITRQNSGKQGGDIESWRKEKERKEQEAEERRRKFMITDKRVIEVCFSLLSFFFFFC